MAWIYQDQVHVCVQAKLDKGPWTWKSGLRSKIASSSHVFSTLISDHIVWYEKIKLNICFWLDFTFNLCTLYCMWFCFLKLFLTNDFFSSIIKLNELGLINFPSFKILDLFFIQIF